jgi:hypothetical protein
VTLARSSIERIDSAGKMPRQNSMAVVTTAAVAYLVANEAA